MTHARHDHRDSGRIGGRHHFRVFDRTSRLDCCGDARLDAKLEPVWKWKERVRGKHGAARSVAGALHSQVHGFDPRHLPGPDTDRGAVLEKDDGVGLHMLDRRPGKTELLPLPFGRRPLGDRSTRGAVESGSVPLLDQQTAWH